MSDRDSYFDQNRLIGSIRFESFSATRTEGEALVNDSEAQQVEIDLAGLTYANSLAVSLMVAWYRHGFRQGKVVLFSNVPEDLRKIIDVSGLGEFLFQPAGTS